MHELTPGLPASSGDYRVVSGWQNVRRGYAQYLSDESRLTAGRVEAVHFPETPDDVAAAVRAARAAGHRVAVSGARTGITGAAVPVEAEEVIALERIHPRPAVRQAPDGRWFVCVGAGTTLAELADALDHGLCDYPDGRPARPLFYPVDSTETSAQIGGTIATNASGARTLHYGPTRRWVKALTAVTADGRILELERGRVRAADGRLTWRRADGTAAEVVTPDIPRPRTKHTAGYALRRDMDAVDLFVGSEGTLGIVARAELWLAEKPANRLFLTQFLDDGPGAVRLVAACLEHPDLDPIALEYIDSRAMALVRKMGRDTPAYVEVSRLPADARAAVYLEHAFEDERHLDRVHAALTDVLARVGLSADRTWAGFADRDLNEMKRLRHAVPETVNAIIGRRKLEMPDLHKVGTDMAVPLDSLQEMLSLYEQRLTACGIEFVIFGHIGDGHLHVNILPRTAEEMARSQDLYMDFAREAVRLGGSVAAEHGIGRLKRKFLAVQFSPSDLAAMRAVKQALDPDGTLNPGVLFET
ncbi:MAG: FAD-binding protein [Candidatus Brocadiaceae bacterium]|nr:FAD-binding protein [Candidatus Brocadiaceae bacterium]